MSWLTPEFYATAYRAFISKRWKHVSAFESRGIIDPHLAAIAFPSQIQNLIHVMGSDQIVSGLRSLIHGLNELHKNLLDLEVWDEILEDYGDVSQRLHLVLEFLDPLSRSVLGFPSILRDRFAYVGTKIGILVSCDPKRKIPKDREIRPHHLSEWIAGWQGCQRFLDAYNKIGGSGFRDETNAFRDRYQHRIPLFVDLGVTADHRFSLDAGKFRMEMRHENPLRLGEILSVGRKQHLVAVEAFELLYEMVMNETGAASPISGGE